MMVAEGNTLYVREWPRAELIGSSRTFQRGNDSVCTDPSFTVRPVEPRFVVQSKVVFGPAVYSPLSSSPLLFAIFFARMGNPAYAVRLVTRPTNDGRLDPTPYTAHTHRDNNVPTLLLFCASAHQELHLLLLLPHALLPRVCVSLLDKLTYIHTDTSASTRFYIQFHTVS